MYKTNQTGGAGQSLYEKTILVFLFFLSAVILLSLLTSCENGLFGNSAYGTVRIDLGAAGRAASEADETGFSAKAVSDSVASFVLTVEAEGMDTIEQSFSGTDIELEVPAGPARTFTLTAYGPEGLKLFSGSAVADVQGGSSVTLTIILKLLSGDAFITSFDLLINGAESDGTYGIINDDLGAVLGVVPVGTSLTELIPVAEVSEGATIDIEEGTAIDFSGGSGISATVTAANGTTKEYEINITGDKLVVLDADQYSPGGRIVQIDDMSGSGLIDRYGTNLEKPSNDKFIPYDIDFDIYGRIYVANNVAGGGFLRLDSITDPTPEWFFTDKATSAVAVDRANSLVYFIGDNGDSTNNLRRCGYDGQDFKEYSQLIESSSTSYTGLTVDDDGILYYTDMPASTGKNLVKFDPAGAGTPLVENYTEIDTFDITFKKDLLYASYTSTAPNKVVTLSKDLVQNGPELPIVPTSGDGHTDDVARPTRFIAVLNRKFYLIDDAPFEPSFDDRLLAFNDLTTGIDEVMWGGSNGSSGPNTFEFFTYNIC